MEFNDEKRSPIIPLSFDNKELARNYEFLIDYKTNILYIKNINGEYINILHSEATCNDVANYLKSNPNTLTSITIITPTGDEMSIQETFANLYITILEITKKEYIYASSDTDGGNANIAKRLNSYLNIINTDGTRTIYNGSENAYSTVTDIYPRSGGHIEGDVNLDGKLILTENIMYGPDLPETGIDGQLFILLEE